MLKTARSARHVVRYWLTAGALVAAIGGGAAHAQLILPTQGYEATGQAAKNYTPEEAEAVAVVQKWFASMTNHDMAGNMALVSNDVAFRGDPVQPLVRGADGYCGAFTFPTHETSVYSIDELYVVGGPKDALILMKRADINEPAGDIGFLGGYRVPVAVLVRVHDGKVTEWYDVPVNKVSIAALPIKLSFAGPAPVPARCAPYKDRVAPAKLEPAQLQPAPPFYGTSKPQFWFNPDEASAARAVRAWFAAHQAGNPLLLGATVDRKVSFRPSPADGLSAGRDDLLKKVCGVIGHKVDVKELFVVGGDYDTAVLARWDQYGAKGKVTRMGSFFRVQGGVIVEAMDSVLDGDQPAADPKSEACNTVNATLAAAAAVAARRPSGLSPGAMPPDGAPPPGMAPPTGAPPPGAAPPAGGPPQGAAPAPAPRKNWFSGLLPG